MTPTHDDLRYPVGTFDWSRVPPAEMRAPAIEVIAALPGRMREAVRDLTDAQLDTPYRPGGWTVRQVVHHVADSHAHGYIRTKFALTESIPAIRPYDQDRWAALPDVRLPVAVSLAMLESLHARWAFVWQSLSDAEFARTFDHPELGRLTLDQQLQGYAWHSRHHLAHVTSLRRREGWGD